MLMVATQFRFRLSPVPAAKSLLNPPRGRLPAVAQTGRDAVDRQVDAGHDIFVRVARAITLQQLDLHVIERVDVREAVPDRAPEQRVALEQALLACDRQ